MIDCSCDVMMNILFCPVWFHGLFVKLIHDASTPLDRSSIHGWFLVDYGSNGHFDGFPSISLRLNWLIVCDIKWEGA